MKKICCSEHYRRFGKRFNAIPPQCDNGSFLVGDNVWICHGHSIVEKSDIIELQEEIQKDRNATFIIIDRIFKDILKKENK